MIIQILLTLFAWKKGWGPKALLPIAVGVGIVILGAMNGSQIIPATTGDILIDVVLGIMILNGRKQSKAAVAPVAVPAAVPEASQRPAA